MLGPILFMLELRRRKSPPTPYDHCLVKRKQQMDAEEATIKPLASAKPNDKHIA